MPDAINLRNDFFPAFYCRSKENIEGTDKNGQKKPNCELKRRKTSTDRQIVKDDLFSRKTSVAQCARGFADLPYGNGLKWLVEVCIKKRLLACFK